VVAAVIQRDDGRFLLSRRAPGSHLGGLWEFPGGAVEDGETPGAALQRELLEELGVEVEVGEPVTFAFNRDRQREVVLLFFKARITRGVVIGREGQEVEWFAPAELPLLPMPPADNQRQAAAQPRGAKEEKQPRSGRRRMVSHLWS
jgi:8-oxo-dGTP diphosphatase